MVLDVRIRDHSKTGPGLFSGRTDRTGEGESEPARWPADLYAGMYGFGPGYDRFADMYYQYYQTVNADPGRIAAQVVSGIGFLGAGTIMREGATVRGLTTAAGLWVVACIGLAVGAGLYIPAMGTTALILFVLVYFAKFEEKFTGLREFKAFVIVLEDKPGQVGRIGSLLGDMGVLIKNIQLERLEDIDSLEVELLLQLPAHVSPSVIAEELARIPGCQEVDRIS